jgi:glycosidase
MGSVARWLGRTIVAVINLLLIAIVLTACEGTATSTAAPEPTVPSTKTPTPALSQPPDEEAGWWSDTVFYEVFVRSFYDSDGDGNGDLTGLIEKLDYLNDGNSFSQDDLGITGVWLMPIMESPSYHGYDVVDYYTVEKDYGTSDDFRTLIAEAHDRGIRVIVDLVLNHTSWEHPWFVDAVQGPQAERRDWYIWRDENPAYVGPWGQKVWYAYQGDYYYAIFWEGMPDLNYRNPEVTEVSYAIARFWLDEMGVDGFRLDAAQYLIEDGQQQAGASATHAWWAAFDEFTDEIGSDVLTVGEVWADTGAVTPYVVNDELDLAFEFNLASAIMSSVKGGDPGWFDYVLDQVEAGYPPRQYATFLTNHDQNRVMNQLRGDSDAARLAATLLLTLPGTPFIYYGEEIGMTGQKPDEMIRTPMQWTAEENAGFTSERPWEPVNADYETVNVAAQATDPDSLLSHYRRLIHLRNEHSALRRGELRVLESTCKPVYGYLRHHEDQSMLVILNFALEEQRGCAFSVSTSDLTTGDYVVQALLTGVEVDELTVGEGGGFADYVPREILPPRDGAVLLIAPGS